MIAVCYSPDGMKYTVAEDITIEEFWELFRLREERCLLEDPDRNFLYADKTSDTSFEVTDERLAASTKTFIARPDDWPSENGEPL